MTQPSRISPSGLEVRQYFVGSFMLTLGGLDSMANGCLVSCGSLELVMGTKMEMFSNQGKLFNDEGMRIGDYA